MTTTTQTRKPLAILEDIRVASPCTMSWDDMTGGDRVRFCAACQKNVFNIADMTRKEAMDLFRSTEGRVCARFYRRKDGTILTADCPVGVRMAAKRAKKALFAAVGASLGVLGAFLAFFVGAPLRRVAIDPTVSTTTSTYTKSVLVGKPPIVEPTPIVELVQPHVELMGDIVWPGSN